VLTGTGSSGGNGSNGVVVIRYAGDPISTAAYTGTMSTTTSGGFTTHTLTTSGTFTT
jgi:hypothetical protein